MTRDEEPARADLEAVQQAYGSWSATYIDRFDGADKASEEDRDRITRWARSITGPVLDAGCGPGHWSAHLHGLGLDVEGVDATPAFVDHARRAHPEVAFRQGDLRRLDLAPASLGGVLAWFSLIHGDPDDVRGALASFAAALRPGGSLLIGFFSGAALAPFEHRVVTAWAWPPDDLAQAVEHAGLEVVDRTEQVQPSGRVFASMSARKR